MSQRTASEITRIVESYLSQRGVRDNWLIGKGVLLHPTFSVKVAKGNGEFSIRIAGANGEVFNCSCTDIVVSKYRPHITFVHSRPGQQPRIRKLVPLQPARQKLLSHVPPGRSVESNKFYQLSAVDGNTQVNARRRWGELRTEYGFDTTYDGGHFYRGDERPVAEPNPRPNMGSLDRDHRDVVYNREQGKCNKCGTPIVSDDADGEPGLLDHRRPVPFGGTDDRDNLQLFCVVCNNTKNTFCLSCPFSYQCESCTWAYPEKFHDRIVVKLTPNEASSLKQLADSRGEDPRTTAQKLFKQTLRDEA